MTGFCECGCGQRTNVARDNDAKRGYVKGKPYRFAYGHRPENRKPVQFVVTDRGYETPCWVWAGACQQGGYAITSIKHKTLMAHRVYWEREHGPIPDGFQIDHLCRVRNCVNSAHMQLVNAAENVRRKPGLKLSHAKCAEILAMRATGMLQREVADVFGVSRQTISDVERGRIWAVPSEVIASV